MNLSICTKIIKIDRFKPAYLYHLGINKHFFSFFMAYLYLIKIVLQIDKRSDRWCRVSKDVPAV